MKMKLEAAGHEVYLPNCITNPNAEAEAKLLGSQQHAEFKSTMYRQSAQITSSMDAILVLNYTKDGVDGYVGGATFLEMYDAFKLGKAIYMCNNVAPSILEDEIRGFSPTIIHGDISRIHNNLASIERSLR